MTAGTVRYISLLSVVRYCYVLSPEESSAAPSWQARSGPLRGRRVVLHFAVNLLVFQDMFCTDEESPKTRPASVVLYRMRTAGMTGLRETARGTVGLRVSN